MQRTMDTGHGPFVMRKAVLIDSPSRRLLAVAAFASLLAFSAFKTPVPGSDEPHYLSKARHYWDPGWCERDLFLQSADAHLVFYQTVGSLTKFCTFAQTAWIGRILALALVALGWTAMVSRLIPARDGGEHSSRWPVLWAIWAYLFLYTLDTFSREWIIEGVEAKVFAYGLVFIGLAFAFDRSWIWAAAALGAATSFHPVVGGWSVLCAVFAAAMEFGREVWIRKPERERTVFPSAAVLLPIAAAVFLVAALPGLIPAVQLLSDGAPPEIVTRAESIQVFGRLAHHMNPRSFGAPSYVLYAALLLMWLLARPGARLSDHEPFLAWFVVGSILVAGAGLLIGWNTQPLSDQAAGQQTLDVLRIRFLKFYPFRLFDAVMPIAVAIVVAGWARRLERTSAGSEAADATRARSLLAGSVPTFGLWLLFSGAFVAALWIPSIHRNSSALTQRQLADFKDACRWIESNTPADALFLTPLGRVPFKWYAGRAEWFSYKDCPQDARRLVEWNRRLVYRRQWARLNWPGGYSRDEVAQFQRDTHIDYILASSLGPFEDPPLYQNGSFRIYRVKVSNADNSVKQALETPQ